MIVKHIVLWGVIFAVILTILIFRYRHKYSRVPKKELAVFIMSALLFSAILTAAFI